jgi:acyl carrier protein
MEKFLEILGELFERNIDTIKTDDSFRDYEGWDSLTLLGMGAMIYDEYGLTIPRTDFEKIQTVQELFEYIQCHKK